MSKIRLAVYAALLSAATVAVVIGGTDGLDSERPWVWAIILDCSAMFVRPRRS